MSLLFFTLDFPLHFVLVVDIVLVGNYLSSPFVGLIYNCRHLNFGCSLLQAVASMFLYIYPL